MNLKQLFSVALLVIFMLSCSSDKKTEENKTGANRNSIIVKNDFQKYFDSCAVEGAVVIYDNNKQTWIVSDTVGSKQETLPASTFKIINLLIALETNTIKDEHEVVKWVGSIDTVKYGYRPEIYHDMAVEEAFQVSAGWVFIELAKKIGRENYQKYLSLCNYGNGNLSQQDADFWNFGSFAISPQNQVEFIKKLYLGQLPFSKRNIDIVKRVMRVEETEAYTISAKTGWTRENNTNTGWWVGFVETKTNVYFFATRLLQDRALNRDDFGACRKTCTKNIFRDLEIIN
jgi:beta-lactamase class D